MGARAMRLYKAMNMVKYSQLIYLQWSSIFTLPPPFDFFSAMYFFKARRLFCRLRLCEFFRASCFMLILLVRRDKPASVRRGVPHGERLATHAGLESCVAGRAMTWGKPTDYTPRVGPAQGGDSATSLETSSNRSSATLSCSTVLLGSNRLTTALRSSRLKGIRFKSSRMEATRLAVPNLENSLVSWARGLETIVGIWVYLWRDSVAQDPDPFNLPNPDKQLLASRTRAFQQKNYRTVFHILHVFFTQRGVPRIAGPSLHVSL
jgi:hypothetical protein